MVLAWRHLQKRLKVKEIKISTQELKAQQCSQNLNQCSFQEEDINPKCFKIHTGKDDKRTIIEEEIK